MTDQEQYAVIGKIVTEHERTKREVAALSAKMQDVGTLLKAAGAGLVSLSKAKASSHNLEATIQAQAAPPTVWGKDQYRDYNGAYPTIEELDRLIRELDRLRQQEEDLARKRKELGA